jgi:hypothetical protein
MCPIRLLLRSVLDVGAQADPEIRPPLTLSRQYRRDWAGLARSFIARDGRQSRPGLPCDIEGAARSQDDAQFVLVEKKNKNLLGTGVLTRLACGLGLTLTPSWFL